MKVIRYGKYTGEPADAVDLNELLKRLGDFFLQSGFESQYYGVKEFDNDRSMEALREAILRALQEGDQAALHRCIARSWDLNKRLDPGTTTPQIERIIRLAGEDLAACKLLGAGGGGYMLLCAASAEAGRRIRRRLENRPPNARARFIDFRVSDRAVEVTVS